MPNFKCDVLDMDFTGASNYKMKSTKMSVLSIICVKNYFYVLLLMAYLKNACGSQSLNVISFFLHLKITHCINLVFFYISFYIDMVGNLKILNSTNVSNL